MTDSRPPQTDDEHRRLIAELNRTSAGNAADNRPRNIVEAVGRSYLGLQPSFVRKHGLIVAIFKGLGEMFGVLFGKPPSRE